MTIWYVHRRADKSIASAHAERQPGYADEALDDASNAEIITYRNLVTTMPSRDASLTPVQKLAQVGLTPADLASVLANAPVVK